MTPQELLLNEFTLVSVTDIAASSGLSPTEIEELVDLGVFEPRAHDATRSLFSARCIELARAARRLQLDFELPLAGVALALTYRERIRELEERLHRIEAQLPGRLRR
jgi:hypothetical protein